MKRNNYYDVTDWQVGNPYTDIGEVINSIIAKSRGVSIKYFDIFLYYFILYDPI